jgi:predicted permease
MWHELLEKIRYLLMRRKLDRDLTMEMQFHVETRAAELCTQGLPADDATWQAKREFGSVSRLKEDSHAAWEMIWLENLTGSLWHAARAFRRNPAFTAIAVLCLALGIGANATIFSLTMEALFSRPSCVDPNSVAYVRVGGSSNSPLEVWRFIKDAHTFPAIAGVNELAEANWRNGEDSSHLWEARVTPNFFTDLGVPVFMGQPIGEHTPDAAVISYRMWQVKFAGQPDIVGRKLILDGELYKVVGVLPSDHKTLFGLGLSPDVYLTATRPTDSVMLYARLPTGMSKQEAVARLRSTAKRMDGVLPRSHSDSWAANVEASSVTGIERLRSLIFLPIAGFFSVLMVVVGLLLLIACANVASLLLARAAARQQEMGIRAALGASRFRIALHLFAESFLLALLGAAAGFLLDVGLTKLINGINLPLPIPVHLNIKPDFRLLVYLTGLAVTATVAAGLAPALAGSRVRITETLKREERQVGRSFWSLRSLLVAGQLAVSTMLLVTGILFLRNLIKAGSMSPGFDLEHTAWSYMRLVPERYTSPARVRTLSDAAIESLLSIPGVDSAALASVVPLNGNTVQGTPIRVDNGAGGAPVRFKFNTVGPGYFHTMGIPLLAGREFRATERGRSPTIAILNETMARRLFGDRNPIGHTIQTADPPPVTIVGVAKNSKYFTLGERGECALYESSLESNDAVLNLNFLIRTTGDPTGSIEDINRVLGRIDRTASIETKPMKKALGLALLPSYAGAAITGSIGFLGALLAATGLYGLVLFTTGRRTREIGLRLALGATPRDVIRLVLLQSFVLTAAGVSIGLAIGWFATKPLATFLVPELSPSDPMSFAFVVVFLSLVSILAALPPVLRAARIDPMSALRYE